MQLQIHTAFEIYAITLVNKEIVPWGKMAVSDVFLDAEFKCFQNFSNTHTFCIASD